VNELFEVAPFPMSYVYGGIPPYPEAKNPPSACPQFEKLKEPTLIPGAELPLMLTCVVAVQSCISVTVTT